MRRSILLLFASSLALSACNQQVPGGSATEAKAGTQSGISVASMDKSVAPGDDFNLFANGGWQKSTEIPADKSNISSFSVVNDLAEKRTADLIADLAKANPTSGDDARIANFYNAYLDTNAIEQKSVAPLKADLDRIQGIADKGALADAIGASIRADTDPFNNNNYNSENLFGIFTTQSLADPTTTVPYLMQGGIGLPDRDYYLSADPEMAKIRAAYTPYVARMMTLAGLADAEARAAKVVALEHMIAEAHISLNDSQDSIKGNNPMKRSDLIAKAPGLDWNRLFTAAKLPNQQDFIVWQPTSVVKLAALVGSQPIEVWRDWMAFHRINMMTDALPKAYDDAKFAFYGTTLSGQPQQRTRDKRALAATSRWLGDAVGKRYADKYFPASSKTDIQTMVTGIKAAFEKRIAGLDWMAASTKAEAQRKVATMAVGVGFPDKWHSYDNFEVVAGDAYGNLDRARRANYESQIAKIGKPVDKNEWWMSPQTVNALNLPLQNALNFPAAILDKGFFDPGADAAANYGAIGSVIGHEISHSFDNLGATFDAEGRLRNWWTPADLAHFQKAGQALIDQYNAYEALPGLRLNGKQELGENIADVAGLSAAYDAYHASLNGKPAPVIDGMTGDQRFFLAYGQSHSGKLRDAALRGRIATDVHAPGPWRVQTVRNLDAWYDAFAVKPGQKLFLAPDKRVKVW